MTAVASVLMLLIGNWCILVMERSGGWKKKLVVEGQRRVDGLAGRNVGSDEENGRFVEMAEAVGRNGRNVVWWQMGRERGEKKKRCRGRGRSK